MFWAGIFGGLTAGFKRQRPYEGWAGAIQRATRVFAVAFLLLMATATAWFFIHRYYVEPQHAAKRARHTACIEAQGPVPYGVMAYPAEYWEAACKHLEP